MVVVCQLQDRLLGTPIHVFVPNTDQRGFDYNEMSVAYRPSHADATYDMKYGVRSVQREKQLAELPLELLQRKFLSYMQELRFLLMSLKSTRLYFLKEWLIMTLFHLIR
uniref:chorismate synthase n=1 Tax=Salix viminalis TaxID=40686 RepID=A0A6N2LSV3_SALVM